MRRRKDQERSREKQRSQEAERGRQAGRERQGGKGSQEHLPRSTTVPPKIDTDTDLVEQDGSYRHAQRAAQALVQGQHVVRRAQAAVANQEHLEPQQLRNVGVVHPDYASHAYRTRKDREILCLNRGRSYRSFYEECEDYTPAKKNVTKVVLTKRYDRAALHRRSPLANRNAERAITKDIYLTYVAGPFDNDEIVVLDQLLEPFPYHLLLPPGVDLWTRVTRSSGDGGTTGRPAGNPGATGLTVLRQLGEAMPRCRSPMATASNPDYSLRRGHHQMQLASSTATAPKVSDLTEPL